jgi:hypothetical protein
MATKAEQFKALVQRSGHKSAQPSEHKRPSSTAAESAAGVPWHAPVDPSAVRNVSKRAARKAEVKLEESRTRPSRKSTRRSANKGKIANNLERRQIRRANSPQSRAARAR